MGVYIKDLEMPMSCRQCSLYLQSMDSERNVYENCAVTAKSYNWGLTTRPSDCPLIPVPPHGRLIDADALWVEINKICDRRDAGIITDLTCLQQILSAVRHAPTVIDAEEV